MFRSGAPSDSKKREIVDPARGAMTATGVTPGARRPCLEVAGRSTCLLIRARVYRTSGSATLRLPHAVSNRA